MKSFVVVLLKFTLAALFLWNIGAFSLISTQMHTTIHPPMKADNGVGDRKYLNKKTAIATALGKKYTPELYFQDLTDIRLKEKRNDFDYYVVINVNPTLNTLNVIFHQNLQDLRMHGSDEEYKLFLDRLSAARDKHEETVDPGSLARQARSQAEMRAPHFWSNLLLSVLVFLGNFYFKNFLLGFALLWIWWFQDKEKIGINNPLSFLICVLLYPITIVSVWIRSAEHGVRKYAMSVELKRRQADIFSLFSENEISEIKKFAKSNLKIKDYRIHLDGRGLIRQQALIPAMVVILLLVILPKSFASPVSHKSVDTIKYQTEIKAPPDIGGSHSVYHDNVVASAITYQDQIFFHFNFIWQRVFIPTAKQHLGFRTNPDPVPLFN
jgi:hypothetical protein